MVTEYFFDDIIIGLKKGLVTNMVFFTLKNDNSARLTIFLIDKYMQVAILMHLFVKRKMIMIFIQYVHSYCSSSELGPIFPWEVTKKCGFYTKQIVERYLKVRLFFI